MMGYEWIREIKTDDNLIGIKGNLSKTNHILKRIFIFTCITTRVAWSVIMSKKTYNITNTKQFFVITLKTKSRAINLNTREIH